MFGTEIQINAFNGLKSSSIPEVCSTSYSDSNEILKDSAQHVQL